MDGSYLRSPAGGHVATLEPSTAPLAGLGVRDVLEPAGTAEANPARLTPPTGVDERGHGQDADDDCHFLPAHAEHGESIALTAAGLVCCPSGAFSSARSLSFQFKTMAANTLAGRFRAAQVIRLPRADGDQNFRSRTGGESGPAIEHYGPIPRSWASARSAESAMSANGTQRPNDFKASGFSRKSRRPTPAAPDNTVALGSRARSGGKNQPTATANPAPRATTPIAHWLRPIPARTTTPQGPSRLNPSCLRRATRGTVPRSAGSIRRGWPWSAPW